jgi:DNA-binding response OmpR family regulator
LLARVAALARRAPREPSAVDLGSLRVDPARGDASWRGRRLQLTPRERAVLYVLAEAVGATVRREVLYRAVWGYAMARGDRTVDVNVKRLRDKLATAVGPPLSIETEPAVGYRLIVVDAAVTAL